MQTTQTRENDGRFGHALSTEPDGIVENGSMESSRSFCFPPRFDTAAELIEYMETTEIEDITLSNVRYAYTDYANQVLDKDMREWQTEWEKSAEFAELETSYIGRGEDAWQARGRWELQLKRDEMAAQRPMSITPGLARDLAIYGSVSLRSGFMKEDEAQKA